MQQGNISGELELNDLPIEASDNEPQQGEQLETNTAHPCRINLSKSQYYGFFRKIQSVVVPEVAAEISMLEGDLDDAETQLKLNKANYKRRYLYISASVAATVSILQLTKQWTVNNENANMGIDFASAIITIIGTATTSFVKAWDDTADDHLKEIEKSRQTLATYSPV